MEDQEMQEDSTKVKPGKIWLKDITLIATLSYFGHPIRELHDDFVTDKHTGEKRPFNFFVFKDTADVQKVIKEFENDQVVVNPRRFSLVMRECKSRLYESKNRLREGGK